MRWGKESGRHEGAEGAEGARPVADAIELRLTGATSERVSLGGDGAEAVFHALNAPTGGGSPSSRAASASAPGGTTSRAQRRAQVRSCRSQSRAWRQPGGAPASIVRSMASSVPCSWPSPGSAGKPRAAASFAGVRWCRWSRSAAPAPARASSSVQAATSRSQAGSSTAAKTRSGA
jgi:hypothetical protein